MKHALLFLVMLLAMPSLGIAHEFSYDNVSRKYPLDSEYFAFEASQEIAKTYNSGTKEFIVIPAKNDRLIDKLNTFMVRNGFSLNGSNSDSVVMSYVFDFIDKKRAYLRLEFSDGRHIGVVRNLGEQTPFYAPTEKFTEIIENKDTAPAKKALLELDVKENSLKGTSPILVQPKIWVIKQGSLMNQLDEWAKGEGWKLIWQANYDLELNAEASFAGDFIQVIQNIFNSLPKRNNGLRVNLYKQNRVVEVIGE